MCEVDGEGLGECEMSHGFTSNIRQGHTFAFRDVQDIAPPFIMCFGPNNKRGCVRRNFSIASQWSGPPTPKFGNIPLKCLSILVIYPPLKSLELIMEEMRNDGHEPQLVVHDKASACPTLVTELPRTYFPHMQRLGQCATWVFRTPMNFRRPGVVPGIGFPPFYLNYNARRSGGREPFTDNRDARCAQHWGLRRKNQTNGATRTSPTFWDRATHNAPSSTYG